jgi:hypothetical protein
MTATPWILRDCKLYLDQWDLSGISNQLSLSQEFDEVECLAFGDTCRHGIPGLAKVSFEHQGYWAVNSTGTDAPDDAVAANLAVASVPMMVCPTTGVAGTPCYFAPKLTSKYTWGGTVGDINAYTITGSGQGHALVRGTVMGTGAKTSTAAGTAYQLGQVSAAQKLYAQLHVFAVAGTDPTLDVIVESDNAEGFASGATRITFAQATAVGSEWATPVAGAITDDWWRISWTIGGTDNPSFTIAVGVGIR